MRNRAQNVSAQLAYLIYVFFLIFSGKMRVMPRLVPWTRLTKVRCFPPVFHTRHSHTKKESPKSITILSKDYPTDEMTNLSPSILAKIGASLHREKYSPICLIRQRIQDYFYRNFTNRTGNPRFAVFDNMDPVVTLQQNFDSLLVPTDHPSRAPKVNRFLLYWFNMTPCYSIIAPCYSIIAPYCSIIAPYYIIAPCCSIVAPYCSIIAPYCSIMASYCSILKGNLLKLWCEVYI